MFKAVNTIKSQIITVTSLCLVVLLMGIFFASQSYSVAVDAVTIKNKNNEESKWNLKIDSNYYKEDEAGLASPYHRVTPSVVVTDVNFANANEYIEYTFLVENSGNMPATIDKVNIIGLTETVEKTIKLNGEVLDLTQENVINAGEQAYVTVRVTTKENAVLPLHLKLITTVEYK